MVTYRNVTVERLGHACVRVETSDGQVLYVNPWSEAIGASPKDADVVFVTDDDFDYYDPAGIEAVSTPESTVVVHESVDASGLDRDVLRLRRESLTVDGVEARAVRGRARSRAGDDPGTVAADSVAVGLLLTLAETTIYLPGDAEVVDLKAASQADVFIPPVGSYYASADQALPEFEDDEGPDLVLPVHYHTVKMVRRLIRDFEALRSERSGLESRLEDHWAAIESLKDTAEDHDAAIEGLRNRTVHVDDRERSLEEGIERLDSLVAAAADDEAIHGRLEELDQRIDDGRSSHEAAIDGLREDVSELRSRLRSQKSTHQTDAKQLSRRLDALGEEVEDRTGSIERELGSLEADLEQLESKHDADLAERESAHTTLEERVEGLREDLDDRLSTADRTLEELRAELESLRTEHREQAATQSALEGLREEVDQLETALEAERADRRERVRSLREDLSAIGDRRLTVAGESVTLSSALRDLNRSVDSIEDRLPEGTEAELSRLGDELEALRSEVEAVESRVSDETGDRLDALAARVRELEERATAVAELSDRVEVVDEDYREVARAVTSLSNEVADAIQEIVDAILEHDGDLTAVGSGGHQLDVELGDLGPTRAPGDDLYGALDELHEARDRRFEREDEASATLRRLSKRLSELRAAANRATDDAADQPALAADGGAED